MEPSAMIEKLDEASTQIGRFVDGCDRLQLAQDNVEAVITALRGIRSSEVPNDDAALQMLYEGAMRWVLANAMTPATAASIAWSSNVTEISEDSQASLRALLDRIRSLGAKERELVAKWRGKESGLGETWHAAKSICADELSALLDAHGAAR